MSRDRDSDPYSDGDSAAGADETERSDDGDLDDIERAIARIRARGEAVRVEQRDRALSQLGGEAQLTDAQRAAVEQLSRRLVDRLLAVPLAKLRRVESEEATETAETALSIFGRSERE